MYNAIFNSNFSWDFFGTIVTIWVFSNIMLSKDNFTKLGIEEKKMLDQNTVQEL